MRAARATSLAAVVTLAIGTAASTAVLAIAHAVLLNPLPFPDPEALFTIQRHFTPVDARLGVTQASFEDWRTRLADVAAVAGMATDQRAARRHGVAQPARLGVLVGPFFEVLGTRPAAGRTLSSDERSDAAVASMRFAARHAVPPAKIVGESFVIDSRTITIVGVMPASFSVIGEDVDLWLTSHSVAPRRVAGRDNARIYGLTARVHDGRRGHALHVKSNQVIQELEPVQQAANWRAIVRPLPETLIGQARPILTAFVAAAVLLLLVACANVTTILVSRSIGRSTEFAVRLALGASRGRLVRIALLETMILALAASSLGWWLARVAVAGMQSVSTGLPRLGAASLDGPLVVSAVGSGLVVTMLCGIAPAIAARHTRLLASFRSAAASASRSSRRLRGALVIAQLAMAIVLVTGAGLLGRTLAALTRTDLGLREPDRVLWLRLPLSDSTRSDDSSRAGLVDEILRQTRAIAGVEAAGIGAALPPSASHIAFTVRVTLSTGTHDATRTFDLIPATDGYLEALGAELAAGRTFDAAEVANQIPVAILSESFVKHLEPIGAPLGRELNLRLPTASGERVKPRTVGVIRDIRYSGLETSALGAVFVPWRQLPAGAAYLIVRAKGDPRLLAPAIAGLVRSLDPGMPLAEPHTLQDEVSRVLAPRDLRFTLGSFFAAAAAALAIVGLAAVLVRFVAERRRELAIRAALGATPPGLVRLVVRHGLLLTLAGTAVGLAASAAAGRWTAGLVFGVSVYDPVTYGATFAGVAVVCGCACYLPARRAAAVDPAELLRTE